MIYTLFRLVPLKLPHVYSLCLEFKTVQFQTEEVNRSGDVNCIPGKSALFSHLRQRDQGCHCHQGCHNISEGRIRGSNIETFSSSVQPSERVRVSALQPELLVNISGFQGHCKTTNSLFFLSMSCISHTLTLKPCENMGHKWDIHKLSIMNHLFLLCNMSGHSCPSTSNWPLFSYDPL